MFKVQDPNDLRLDPILALSPNLKQEVQSFTRMNPPRLLDPIISTLGRFYQVPEVLPPLDADPDSNGKPSDHMMVVFTPITALNNRCAKMTKKITFRPLNENGMQKMKEWLENECWTQITNEKCANSKAEMLQNLFLSKCNEYFPEKTRIISSNDQPYFSHKLTKLRRKKNREYKSHRRSTRWISLEKIYQMELSKAKKMFYRKRIKALRKAKPGKWYSELKKLTNFDQLKNEVMEVESIKDLPASEQAELIADNFSKVANEYDKLKTEDINIPEFSVEDIPQFSESDVELVLSEMDPNKSNVKGDIPVKLLKNFSKYFAKPVKDLLNSSIRQGRWPDIFKMEMVTPVPK